MTPYKLKASAWINCDVANQPASNSSHLQWKLSNEKETRKLLALYTQYPVTPMVLFKLWVNNKICVHNWLSILFVFLNCCLTKLIIFGNLVQKCFKDAYYKCLVFCGTSFFTILIIEIYTDLVICFLPKINWMFHRWFAKYSTELPKSYNKWANWDWFRRYFHNSR